MEEKKKTTQEIAKKFLEHQKLIKKYLKGEISQKELNEKGVKLTLPL